MSDAKSAIAEFFARDAGQKRRKWLDSKTDAFGQVVRSLLGPGFEHTGPAIAQGASMMNPVNDIGEAMGAARDGRYIDAAINTATAAAPMAAWKLAGGTLDDAANVVTDTLAGFAPMAQGAADAGRAFAADEFGGVGPSGIRAYHGSPHDFDRFDMSKIGTGEGAQAYGHGLYFAENEGVARGYRDALARGYLRTKDGANVAKEYGSDVADIFERTGGDPQDLKDTVARLRGLVNQNLSEFGVSSVSELKPMFDGDLASTVIEFSNRADRLEKLISTGPVEYFDPGRMYEVRINANPDDFLDWDAPLSEQSAGVRESLKSAGGASEAAINNPRLKGDYAAPTTEFGRKAYIEAGIPGIKYLDQGSRGAGDGTRNYVVFDDRLIEIVRKYGIAGAAALLGVSASDVQAAMGQEQ